MGSSSITGDEVILSADNMSFDGTARAGRMSADGQLFIGSATSNRANNGGHVRLGSLTSPLGTLSIGYNAPNITLDLTGGSVAIDSVQLQSGTSPIAPTATGLITFNGAVVAAGTNPVRTDGTGPSTMALEVQISQALAATDATKIGLSNFNSAQFSVDANGFVSAFAGAFAYTDVTFGMSPYTVLSTDQFISCNTSGGAITLRFPNAPTTYREWIVKDRTGNATANNITVTTVGGAVLFDGAVTYVMNSNFSSIQLLFNAASYEVF